MKSEKPPREFEPSRQRLSKIFWRGFFFVAAIEVALVAYALPQRKSLSVLVISAVIGYSVLGAYIVVVRTAAKRLARQSVAQPAAQADRPEKAGPSA